MSDEPVATSGDSLSPVRYFSDEDITTDFRVVARGGVRRGIRLEGVFWTALKQLAEAKKVTIGMLIDEIVHGGAYPANLTSAIRVACVRGLLDQNSEFRKLNSVKAINAMLVACPSPAFALSSAKKILNFNQPFQQLVRRQLPTGSGDKQGPDLRLSLDLSVADIFSRLDVARDTPVTTGFVIGAADRRYRGQLNLVRAPVVDPELLLAFVFNS